VKSHDKHPRPERGATDESLGDERHKTDEQLAQRRASTEAEADTVVQAARGRADKILSGARSVADEGKHARPAVEEERRLADVALQSERRAEDESIDREREQHQQILTSLLRVERQATDSQLLSERERADAREAAYGPFFGMVSHDLRGMVHSISMAATLLVREAAGEDAFRQCVRERAETIRRNAMRMNRLVGDLLDVAAIEAGNLRLVVEPGDLASLLRDFVEFFEPTAAAYGLSIAAEISDQPPVMARFDRDRIMQVLTNLASNAVRFTPSGGRIQVRLENLKSEIRCSISDTGVGIAQENLKAIFDRFWQANHDRRGVGLGLYICKRIVEAHHGRIWAESTPGKGSTIFLTLPKA
jgi:signal transduction histidine kinase